MLTYFNLKLMIMKHSGLNGIAHSMINISLALFRHPILLVCLGTVWVAVSCEKGYIVRDESSGVYKAYNPDWTFASHGKSDQDYPVVFPQDSVNTIEIEMTSDGWNSIRENMIELFGFDFGSSTMGGGNFPEKETDYVDVLLTFNGRSWKNVGFRLKGNSSLSRAWGAGNHKLPFKLNFDEFEDSYPAIEDQRLYGFKELSFSPAFGDESLMREKIAPDIFRMAGIPAAQTAFYKVYIDFGEGLKYCGVYTAVEYPEDNMINAQFGEEDGNIYKPESKLSNFIQTEFDKKNNELEDDCSDVLAFVTALNSSLRTTDVEQWRAGLENTFNIDHFIKYLAVNNAIVNWDSYGNMAHNYYLYNHSINKLTWIPWDHNEALNGSPGITGTGSSGAPDDGWPGDNPPGDGPPDGGPGDGWPGGDPGDGPINGGPGGGNRSLSLSMNEVASNWPLIYYIVTDEVYMAKYKEYLKWFNEEVFTQEALDALIDKYYTMIAPYVIGENGEQEGYTYLDNEQSFINAYNELKTHISDRKTLISTYVP